MSLYPFNRSGMEKFIYRAACLFLGMLLLASCRGQAPRAFDSEKASAEIDALLLTSTLDAQGNPYRNALLAIDAPTAGFRYASAAGIYRADSLEPMTAERQFNTASVAKAMTAVIIYQLAEEGAFGEKGVEAGLAELNLLPGEVLADLLWVDGVSYSKAITLRHLLTHTSGLRDLYFDSTQGPVSLMPGTAAGAAPDSLVGLMAFDEKLGLPALAQCSLEGLPSGCNPDDYLLRRKWSPWDYPAWQADKSNRMAGLLNFYLSGMNEHGLWHPGGGFHYSDTNYVLLGLIIEKVTGNSLHQELRTRIFDPLGMKDTYLIGASAPPAAQYEKSLAESWAWNQPAMSSGVDFSFDWGGGGIVSTLHDLHAFTRALVSGNLFQQKSTLETMLSVPEADRGISYASGLIVFPSQGGRVIYMMGSNGTWAEYYAPLDLVMIGTTDDFSNMPSQFRLHMSLYAVLARHGLNTPMAKTAGLPMLGWIGGLLLIAILDLVWFSASISARRRRLAVPQSVRLARWLAAAAFLSNLVLLILVGMTFGGNLFQMLFGFTPQVRAWLLVVSGVMGLFIVLMLINGIRIWRHISGTRLDRALLTAILLASLIYALSVFALG